MVFYASISYSHPKMMKNSKVKSVFKANIQGQPFCASVKMLLGAMRCISVLDSDAAGLYAAPAFDPLPADVHTLGDST